MRLIALAVIGLIFSIPAKSQKQFHISESIGSIVIDGSLDDAGWEQVEFASGFQQYFPNDTELGSTQTEVYMTYDDENLYFAAKMYNRSATRDYVTPSLRRDFFGAANDVVTLTIDPFQDNRNAYQFGVNPFGVQREGIIANGGVRNTDLSMSWDNKWIAEARQYEGYWVAEIAIPFKTLRFKEGGKKWNINVYRIDSETGEISTWTPIPKTYPIISLAFLSELIWDKPLKTPGANISVIPYIAGNVSRDFQDPIESAATIGKNVGGDMKIGLGPSMSLDLTFNPDFSQVDVDQQVTNLDRFELFFPEKRQFFLENADMFSDFGHPFLAKPFFSRRVGIASDAQGNTRQNKILYGARLSGKIGNDWRVGLLNMQTAKDDEIGLLSQNYTVATVRKKIFARSTLGAIFVNRQTLEDTNGEVSLTPPGFNRIAGVDLNIASADNKWTGIWFLHKSFGDSIRDKELAHTGYIKYEYKNWLAAWAHVYVGENYETKSGFAPRTGIFRINPEIGYTFFPESGPIVRHGPKLETEDIWTLNESSDRNQKLTYSFQFRNTGNLIIENNIFYTKLMREFDPSGAIDGVLIPAGQAFRYYNAKWTYMSDFRKKLGYITGGSWGSYFNGTRLNLNGSFKYRIQPYGVVELNVNYDRVRLADGYSNSNLFLIGPRFDITMTKKLFFTTFVQYNNQIENVNINSRIQWRFKPVSDLFIVYTDNYGILDLNDPLAKYQPKNRALVLKLTYWLNL